MGATLPRMEISVTNRFRTAMARQLQTLLDLFALSAAYWAAFLLRFDGDLPLQMWKRLFFTWPYVVILEFTVLLLFNIPRFSWRHFGLREAISVGWATAVTALTLLTLRVASEFASRYYTGYGQYTLVPFGIIFANAGFSFIGIVAIRSLRRVVFERHKALRLDRPAQEKIPTLLIGAGQAGALVARELGNRPDLGIRAVGFLDDDRSKRGTLLHGMRVFGTIDQLPSAAKQSGARQVLVTIAEIPPELLRRIVSLCESERLSVKILPGLYQVIEEQAGGLGKLRDVSIEDLLGRDSIQLDMNLVGSFLRGRRVLITGAGGSIGSELCRQVAKFRPEKLVLVERSEFALFSIHQQLLADYPDDTLLPRLCDVCDAERLERVFAEDLPHVVFHAAAHKHVPMMERNPGEALKNNVFGTKAVADASDRHGCEAFVLISTDKAVNPTSIMGATKRVAENYVQALSERSKTKFVAVRFGNVLGSTGSVVPTFKNQIAAGGPVTVTHPEMVRYFMTIPEASQLVMQAAAMGVGGEIFALDMGRPVKIVDLAHDLIRLSGLVPDVDIRIEFTGIRPGEKLFEELGFDAERMDKTAHPKIYRGKLTPTPLVRMQATLDHLEGFIESDSTDVVRRVLTMAVPEMMPSSPPSRPPEASPADDRARFPVGDFGDGLPGGKLLPSAG